MHIGANTTIDCGAIDNTVIKSGVKIDNLVHIAHNCVIGENTIIAAMAGFAGSCKDRQGVYDWRGCQNRSKYFHC